METPFWERPLAELDRQQWEALCDGCARCCLNKLEDEESGELYLTNIACRYLERDTCGCSVYERRTVLEPECIQVTPENAAALRWMPSSCAYRLRAEGKPLPEWHPLISGDADSVREAGMAVGAFAVLESELPEGAELEDFIVGPFE